MESKEEIKQSIRKILVQKKLITDVSKTPRLRAIDGSVVLLDELIMDLVTPALRFGKLTSSLKELVSDDGEGCECASCMLSQHLDEPLKKLVYASDIDKSNYNIFTSPLLEMTAVDIRNGGSNDYQVSLSVTKDKKAFIKEGDVNKAIR